jgi:hypothetical protein
MKAEIKTPRGYRKIHRNEKMIVGDKYLRVLDQELSWNKCEASIGFTPREYNWIVIRRVSRSSLHEWPSNAGRVSGGNGKPAFGLPVGFRPLDPMVAQHEAKRSESFGERSVNTRLFCRWVYGAKHLLSPRLKGNEMNSYEIYSENNSVIVQASTLLDAVKSYKLMYPSVEIMSAEDIRWQRKPKKVDFTKPLSGSHTKLLFTANKPKKICEHEWSDELIYGITQCFKCGKIK